MFKRMCVVLAVSMLIASPLFAESEVACDSSCPSGKVMTSYADGNNVTCVCTDQAAMEPTVPDPNTPNGIDPDNDH